MKKLLFTSVLCMGFVCAAAEQAEQPTLQQAGKTAEQAAQEARDAVLTEQNKAAVKEAGKDLESVGRNIGRFFGRKR